MVGMLVELDKPHPHGYSFVVYKPPAPGLPWMAICLGPNGKVLRAEPFDTEEAAERRIMALADGFESSVKRLTTQH